MLSSFVNQILIMVGQPDFDNYTIEENKTMTLILWIWFVLTLIMTQIVFLNILIAIISDTFDRVWELKWTYIYSSQADLLCDWLNVLKSHNLDNDERNYLYVVTPTFEAEDDSLDNWEGKIAQIKKMLTQSFLDI